MYHSHKPETTPRDERCTTPTSPKPHPEMSDVPLPPPVSSPTHLLLGCHHLYTLSSAHTHTRTHFATYTHARALKTALTHTHTKEGYADSNRSRYPSAVAC